jgi:hypothetical protein
MGFTAEEQGGVQSLGTCLNLPPEALLIQNLLAGEDADQDIYKRKLVDFLLAINEFYFSEKQKSELSAYNIKHLQRIVREHLEIEMSRLDKTIHRADYATSAAFVILPAAQLALIIAQVIFPPLAPVLNITWGSSSGTGIIPTTIDQFKHGEYALGATTATTTAALIGGSVMSGIIEFSPSTLGIGAGISAAVAASILSFAFAGAMFAAACNELNEARKSEELVKSFKIQIDTLYKQQISPESSGNSTGAQLIQKKMAALTNLMDLQKANGSNHKKNAQSWGVCGTIMMGVGVVALLGALGIVSAGIIPLALAAAACTVGIIRWYTTTQIDDVKKIERKNLTTRLEGIVKEATSPNVQSPKKESGTTIAFTNPLEEAPEDGQTLQAAEQSSSKRAPLPISDPMKHYIYELIQKDITKATHVICALEEKNTDKLQIALARQRHSFFQPEKTKGTEIYEAQGSLQP